MPDHVGDDRGQFGFEEREFFFVLVNLAENVAEDVNALRVRHEGELVQMDQ